MGEPFPLTGRNATKDAIIAAHAEALVQRFGKNLGGYFGESIEIEKTLTELRADAARVGWHNEVIAANDTVQLLALRRTTASPARRIYISTGIHGDEPAGPLAALQLIKENTWPGSLDVWLCPCLNPTGFPLSKRECSSGADLNRDYRHFLTPEVRAHVAWLDRQPNFDLCLCLHEDWEAHGFYLYELNPDHRPSLSEGMIAAASRVCPIDHSDLIEGRAAHNGIIRPAFEPDARPQWPEAFYLVTRKTRVSYTLEAPSDFPLQVRVAALVSATRAAIEGMMADI